MDRYGKTISIIVGLGLLVALAFFIAPLISDMTSAASTDDAALQIAVESSDGGKAFANFLSNLEATNQYSFCAVKSISDSGDLSELFFGCTIRENDYAIKVVENDEERRQLFIDGEYTYINDTSEIVYIKGRDIDFPITHLQEALTGKLIHADEEIIDGNHANRVQIYKNGIIYALYFDQRGDLIRFYYIYDSNEIALDFCGFYFDEGLDFVSFNIPSEYLHSNANPSIRRGSNDSRLADLTMDAATIPGFDPLETSYNISVPFETSAVTIGAIANDNKAKITGTGAISLVTGDNVVDIVVLAEDQTTKATYTLNIYRNSSDAALSDLKINGLTVIGFDENVTSYLYKVDAKVTYATIGATAKYSGSKITGKGRKTLAFGDNVFNVVVTAKNGVTTQTYTVTIRRGSANSKLSGIKIDKSALLSFDPLITRYSISVPFETASILLAATAEASTATVSGVGRLKLAVGNNTFTIVVTAQDKSTTVYTLNILRNSSDAAS